MSRFTRFLLSIVTLSFVGYFGLYAYAMFSKRIRTLAQALGILD